MYKLKSLRYLEKILKSSDDRKNYLELWKDLIYWGILNNGGIYYFYLLGLQKKGKKIRDYLTVRRYIQIDKKLDNRYYRSLLEDKILFDGYIAMFHIPRPELIGIIKNEKLYDVNRKIWISLEEFSEKPIQAYCKLNTAFGGKEVYKLEINEEGLFLNNKKTTLQSFKDHFKGGKFIVQKTVKQHSQINRLNPSCVNTLRVYTTYNGENGTYFSNFLRMGVGNNIVDNVSNRNIVTGVRSDGQLIKEAHSWTHPPKWYSRHPDTSLEFSSFHFPYFEEAKTLCEDAHRYFPEIFLIAWDVAIQESGPLILEANPAPDLLLVQVLFGGLKKKFLKVVEEYKLTR